MLRRNLAQTWQDLTQPVFLKQMAWAIGFWVLLAINIMININFLRSEYPDPPRPPDLLLDRITEMPAFVTVGEVLSIVMLVLVLYILRQRHFQGGAELLFLVGVMFWIRGYVILLTPLAQIQPPSLNYSEDHFVAQTFYHGMFYSGHTASVFIQALYFKGHRLRPVLLLMASMMAFALIASHSHYTIDIVGGLLMAYFVTHFEWMRLVPERLRYVRWMPWANTSDFAVMTDEVPTQVLTTREVPAVKHGDTDDKSHEFTQDTYTQDT